MQGRARLFSVVLGGSRRSSTLEVDSIHNACTSIFAVAISYKRSGHHRVLLVARACVSPCTGCTRFDDRGSLNVLIGNTEAGACLMRRVKRDFRSQLGNNHLRQKKLRNAKVMLCESCGKHSN